MATTKISATQQQGGAQSPAQQQGQSQTKPQQQQQGSTPVFRDWASI